MSWLICIVVVGAFLYYRRNKVVAASNLSLNLQCFRLLILPVFQLSICFLIIDLSHSVLELLLSKISFTDHIIKNNLGIFSNIASDAFNDYRTDKLAPHIENLNNVHKYAVYLFYGLIASFIFQIVVLKNKICSITTLLYTSILFSVLLLIVSYYFNYYYELGGSAFLSTETLGLLGSSKEKALDTAIGGVGKTGTILFFITYYYNIWLHQYYGEIDEIDITSTGSLIETDSSDEQSDDNKYKNLKDLKALLDAGILTQEEFDAQKKEILNS